MSEPKKAKPVALEPVAVKAIRKALHVMDPEGKRSPAPGSPGSNIEAMDILYGALDAADSKKLKVSE